MSFVGYYFRATRSDGHTGWQPVVRHGEVCISSSLTKLNVDLLRNGLPYEPGSGDWRQFDDCVPKRQAMTTSEDLMDPPGNRDKPPGRYRYRAFISLQPQGRS